MRNFARWSSGCVCGVVAGIVLAWTMTGNARDARPPQDRDALVALAQLVETEHRRVDLLVKAGDRAGAIRALEQLAEFFTSLDRCFWIHAYIVSGTPCIIYTKFGC